MIQDGKIKCDGCGEIISVARICKVFTREKKIETWDMCDSCITRRKW